MTRAEYQLQFDLARAAGVRLQHGNACAHRVATQQSWAWQTINSCTWTANQELGSLRQGNQGRTRARILRSTGTRVAPVLSIPLLGSRGGERRDKRPEARMTTACQCCRSRRGRLASRPVGSRRFREVVTRLAGLLLLTTDCT